MKKVKYFLKIICIVCICSCNTTKSIPTDFECELISFPLKFFKIDVFGNIYTVEKSNRLKVYDQNFNYLFEYFNNGLGNITYLDITNPRKLILFFGGFQKMVFLDNTLSEIARVNVDFSLPYDIRAIGSSRDNHIWIYDALDYKLKKINAQGKVLLESNPLQSYLEVGILPDYIIEYNNEVFLVEEHKGIAVFDNFGNYLRYELLEGITSISIMNNNLVYLQNGNLVQQALNNKFLAPRLIKAVPSQVRTAYVYRDGVYYIQDLCLMKQRLN